ncbi:kinase inhibitor, partial [Salmonella enterica subsp. enterica serovar Lubbock]|nr:kinase inhibitor [Salmonella enterica subsp. enterica serovar Lubbock]
MKLISNDLRDGDKLPHRHVFNGMGYDGDNISPHLAWDDVPMGTKSFVVTCYDPDAPTGSGWWHWVVVNLPADTRVLTQGFGSGLVAVPDGVIQTRTDFGKAGYGGAAPPKGETHRYNKGMTLWRTHTLMPIHTCRKIIMLVACFSPLSSLPDLCSLR